ncbi:MAG: hypothetical protein ABIW79_10585 [Gemmatimonas sp.]
MPSAPPTPAKLQAAVIDDINWMAGPLHQPKPRPKDSLSVLFGLTGYQRRALAAPFEETAQQWNAGARISRSACEDLGTVGDAAALVSKEAGFDGTWVEPKV